MTWPKADDLAISPLSKEDVKLLLASVERSQQYKRHFQREPSTHANPNALRNKAIIVVFLDTGMRVSELCNLIVRDVDLRNREIEIRQGKGKKSRYVPFLARMGKVLWKYLGRRKTGPDDPVFVTPEGYALGTRGVQVFLQRLAEKAGVKEANPHKFRHTFAINYLRNGRNIYVLQEILGHSTLEMVRRYVKLAEQDLASGHQLASPVVNWNLKDQQKSAH